MSRFGLDRDGDAPIIRVHGIDDKTPEGQAILSDVTGIVRQFYASQTHNDALSAVPSTSGWRDHPDYMLRYRNVMGQDIVDVTVKPKRPGKPKPTSEEKPEKKGQYWDAAIIDFDLPLRRYYNTRWEMNIRIGYPGVFYAKCITPISNKPPTPIYGVEYGAATWKFNPFSAEGFTEDPYNAYDGNHPILHWARYFSFEDKKAWDEYWDTKLSLKIDLRPFHGQKFVEFEIYGCTAQMTDWLPTIVDKSQDVFLTSTIGGPWGMYIRGTSGYSQSDVETAYPSVAALGATQLFPGLGVPTPMWSNSESVCADAMAVPWVTGDRTDPSANLSTYSYFLESDIYWKSAGTWDSHYPGSHQSGYLPAVSGDTEPFPWPSGWGNGIYKWQDTQWSAGPDTVDLGARTEGILPNPPSQVDDRVNYYVYQMRAWLVFMPVWNYPDLIVDTSVSATISAAMFKGMPDFVEQNYVSEAVDPDDSSDENAFGVWTIVGQEKRFGLGKIARDVKVQNYLRGLPEYKYNRRDNAFGAPYMGILTIAIEEGWASFSRA